MIKIILQWRCKFLWIHSSTSSWAKNAPQDTNQWTPGYRCASERPERSREALWWDYTKIWGTVFSHWFLLTISILLRKSLILCFFNTIIAAKPISIKCFVVFHHLPYDILGRLQQTRFLIPQLILENKLHLEFEKANIGLAWTNTVEQRKVKATN